MTTTAPDRRAAALAARRPLSATPSWWRGSSRGALVVGLVLVTGRWACTSQGYLASLQSALDPAGL